MGCIPSYTKHCDVCICLLKEYKGQINLKYNNNNGNKNNKVNRTSSFYKKKLNENFEKLNNDIKQEYELKQFKELNEIYQKLLALDSARNNNNNIINENDPNDIYQIN